MVYLSISVLQMKLHVIRAVRAPQTGEEVTVTPRRVVTFKAGQKLKAKVEAYKGTDSGNETK